jgi:Flp pilus assembly protein TadD
LQVIEQRFFHGSRIILNMPGTAITLMRIRLLPASVCLAVAALAGCASGSGPVTGYTAGPIENQLMAEIALQRGEYLVSAQQYLKLAQQSDDPEFARRSTLLAYEYGFDAYALASAQRWVALAPEDQLANGYLGRLYTARNKLDEAWNNLSVALGPAEQRTDEDYTNLSHELTGMGAPGNALALFQRFNDTYPGVPGITGSVASLAADAGDLELAIEAARETLALAPDWIGTRVWLARLLLAADQRSSAFEQMAFALEMNPGLEMELEFVQLMALAGEYETALERLDRLDERSPDSPELRRTKALILLQSGNAVAAQTELMRLVSDAYYVNECFWYLGQIAQQQGDQLQAIRYFGRVSSGPWLVSARLSISQAYMVLGDPDTALQVQRDFANRYPKQRFATLQPQAEILASTGRADEALEMIALALEYKPWDADLWMFYGGLYEQAGDYEKAIKAFRKAVDFAPQNATALNALGYTLTIVNNHYDGAFNYVSQALQLEPDNPAIMDSMGWVLFKQGKADEARPWLERAYQLLPDPEIAAHLGELLWQEGDQDGATDIWMGGLQNDPDNRVLNETIQRFMN